MHTNIHACLLPQFIETEKKKINKKNTEGYMYMYVEEIMKLDKFTFINTL